MLQVNAETAKRWYIDDCKSTEEWLEKRKQGVGASAVGVLLGLDQYRTPQRLYAEMQELVASRPTGPAAQRGHDAEPVIAAKWEREGAIVMHESSHDFLCIDTEKPWRRISPDRFWWPKGTPEAERTIENALLLECKSFTKYDERHRPVKVTAENVFEHFPYWFAQMQYQMGVTRKSKCVLGAMDVMDTDWPTFFLEVPFNESYFNMLMEKVDDFWCNHIMTCVEPDEVICEEDAKFKYSRSYPDTAVVASEEIRQKIDRHNEIVAMMEPLEEEISTIKKDIMDAMKTNEKLVDENNYTLVLWNTCKGREAFDKSAFEQAHPGEYSKFLKRGKDYRTFKIFPSRKD